MNELVERALELSRADACIAIGRASSEANIRWANNTSTTNGVASSSMLTVISIRDGRVGTVSRSYVPADALEDMVRASEAACDGRPRADDVLPLVDGQGDAGWSSDIPDTGIDVFGRFAPDLAVAFERAKGDHLSLYGYAEHTTRTVFCGTSTGLRRRYTQRSGKAEFTAKTAEGTGSSWCGQATADFHDVDVAHAYERLAERLRWSDRSVELPAGRYEVLLEPAAVADMCLYAYWTSAARDADEGRSVYSKAGGGNRIGERLYPDGVTLYSDPVEPGLEVLPFHVASSSSSSSSVFDNGLPLDATQWVSRGELRRLVTPRFWAERNGYDPSPFVPNLVFPGDGPTIEEMVASTKRALVVTCFWYIRTVDPRTLLLTGLTRDGVFLVEDGEVVGAVNNFRFNESPVDLLGRCIQIGRTQPALGRELHALLPFTRMPPLRVDAFNMSSVSAAT